MDGSPLCGRFRPFECGQHELRVLYVAAGFGRTHLFIQGVGQTITVIAPRLAPTTCNIERLFGSYDPMLVGVGLLLFFAVIVLFLRDPVRSVSKDAHHDCEYSFMIPLGMLVVRVSKGSIPRLS